MIKSPQNDISLIELSEKRANNRKFKIPYKLKDECTRALGKPDMSLFHIKQAITKCDQRKYNLITSSNIKKTIRLVRANRTDNYF